ncbi:MAG: hypothetical protein H7249_06385 [Chitinophagaceae bacterium]|nr:hypothetical protein [Oligoflexus sp.]
MIYRDLSNLKSPFVSAVTGLVLGLCCFFSEPSAFAVEAGGQLRLGAYSRSVEFEKPLNTETSNDEKVYSAQLRMSIYDFSSHDDSIVTDIRDKVDSYGKLDTQNLTLDTYNRVQVRELAYKRPWESNQFYFTLGRFSLNEANVLDNDGLEAGYRFSHNSRLGLFGGQAPKDVITPYYVDPTVTSNVNNAQAGVYYSYEKKNGLDRSLYTNNALAMGPTYNITDKQSHTYFYHMALWNLSTNNRISSYLQQDFMPTSSLRRASVSHSYYDPSFRTNVSLSQTNTEDYLIQKDILDPLPPSAEQSLRFDLRHRIFSQLSLDYSAGLSKRTVDGKSMNDLALGVIVQKALIATGSFRAQYGIRKNYFSNDRYVRGGYDYWNQYFSLSIMHTVSTETYDAQTSVINGIAKNDRQVTNLDGGFYFGDRFRGSLGYQREKDDKLSASAFFLMLGYRFGKGTVAPVRTKPALFEEI